jgi:hypothetical protein
MTAHSPFTASAVLPTPPVKARQTPHGNPAVRTTGPASTATPVCNGSGANH